ncbi:Maf family protein [Olegusella massiliensis]
MILASASPRRAELLQAEGFQFETHPAWTDETRAPGEDPVSYVRRLARAKAWVVHNDNPQLAQGETLIAADTIVWT